jgi:hypothetical protein
MSIISPLKRITPSQTKSHGITSLNPLVLGPYTNLPQSVKSQTCTFPQSHREYASAL